MQMQVFIPRSVKIAVYPRTRANATDAICISSEKTPWWLKVAGSFENDPTFDKANRLGQEWRKSAE